MLFGTTDISKSPAHRRCRAGIGRSYQVPQPYGAMTVFENCLVAATFGAGLPETDAYPVCIDVLERQDCWAKRTSSLAPCLCWTASGWNLARALSTRPRLLLLDEIAGGLTEHEARTLVDEIKAIKARGVTMIWIEHVVHALLAVADRFVVLNFGAVLAEGTPTAVLENPEVRRVYMGMEV
ncbi:ABC transporter ATP-binding protein [Pseudoduganella sp. UC29_106]|uniref:ABC transporter ATP-binding protein C-terminal domain-containing protein n=1 Tax=Pseudoduganella sp. UC29_106 TaxID=3374553 RepID=UPI00375760E5